MTMEGGPQGIDTVLNWDEGMTDRFHDRCVEYNQKMEESTKQKSSQKTYREGNQL